MNIAAENAAARSANVPLDPVELAAELSHQLEDAHQKIDTMERALRDLREHSVRAEAARDVLKELLVDALARHERVLK